MQAGDSVMIESFASGITLEARDSFSSTAATTSFTGGDVEIQGLHQVSLSAPDGTSRVESDEAMTATSGGEVLFDGGNVEVFTSGTDKSIIWSATNDRKTMSISSSALTETTSSGLKWTSESGDVRFDDRACRVANLFRFITRLLGNAMELSHCTQKPRSRPTWALIFL